MEHLSEILEDSTKRFPEEIAIIDPKGETISYKKAREATLRLSATLEQSGLGVGHRVGILIPKSIGSVLSILSVLHIHGVYIPTDAHAPNSRNAYIFEDCQVSGILIADALLPAFRQSFPFIKEELPLQDLGLHLLICHYPDLPPLEVPDDLAYMLYTSGSTGKPKGVLISHLNALSFVDWCLDTFDVGHTDIFSSIAPFHFDLSIYDLFVGLKAGASIVLFDQKSSKNPMLLASWIGEFKISVLYATPTLLRMILAHGRIERYDHSPLRIVHFAGEVFPIDPLRSLQEKWATAKFYNLYGPTETNVVTWHPIPEQIDQDQQKPFPIGKSCAHVSCKLWDDKILEPNKGQTGELIVSGQSVTTGYLNMPERTASSIFRDQDGNAWYKTGDLVKVDDAGDFVFIGRRDRMVKRRGYRIELGEIESALSSHPAISEAGLIAFTDEAGQVFVNAFLSVKTGSEAPNGLQLKEFCLQYIPIYMLPDKFIFLEALPKTSTQKIDYQALKKMVHV